MESSALGIGRQEMQLQSASQLSSLPLGNAPLLVTVRLKTSAQWGWPAELLSACRARSLQRSCKTSESELHSESACTRQLSVIV